MTVGLLSHTSDMNYENVKQLETQFFLRKRSIFNILLFINVLKYQAENKYMICIYFVVAVVFAVTPFHNISVIGPFFK